MILPGHPRAHRWALSLLGLVVVELAVLSCSLGPYKDVRMPQVAGVLSHWLHFSSGSIDPLQENVVLYLRLPRVALAILAGAALSLAGAGLQGLFRNPLADPALIGISNSAAAGAVSVIVLGHTKMSAFTTFFGSMAIPTAAMGCAVAATFSIYHLAKVEGRTHLTLMLLVGVAVNALAGAAIGLLIYSASDQQIREFTFWSLGSLTRASWVQIGAAAAFAVPAMLVFSWLARPLNALLLGEAEAFHLGVPVQTVKRLLIFLSAILAGSVVAVCGTIGFLGLVAPHLVRLLLGPDHRVLLPGSALMGAALLLAADILARSVSASLDELPIGVVTALAGAPFFLFLLLRSRRTGVL